MRIPPSVIVMSLLTAVPFGLGIRDTLSHKQPSVDDMLGLTLGHDSERDRDRELDEYRRQAARDAEERAMERAKRREERTAMLDTLYGPKPASLGSLFDGIELGADAGSFQPESARERIYDATRDGFLNVGFDVDSTQLRGLFVEIGTVDYSYSVSAEQTCTLLRDKLITAWGDPIGNTWLDPTTHHRATIESMRCLLRFDRYLEPSDWLAGIHMEAIGRTPEKLAELAGPSAAIEGNSITWEIPGVGAAGSTTYAQAYVENGKVTAITVRTHSDYGTIMVIRDTIAARRKAKPFVEDEGVWTWEGKVPVKLSNNVGALVVLTIGTRPW